MCKVIYIAGLGHSGSTVLDMLLASTGKAVSLGQIWTVLREEPHRRRARVCSCSASAMECEFWGPIIEQMELDGDSAPPSHRYRLVLDRAVSIYGSGFTIIDSSKQAANLPLIAETVPISSIFVIHNIKDVRAFTISMIDNRIRKSQQRELPEKFFCQWYRGNRLTHVKTSRFLGRAPINVTYEALCFTTGAVAQRLAILLGEEYIDPGAHLNSGNTHIISGNRLRLCKNGDVRPLAYDFRWLARPEWLRPYVLMPMIRHYNERLLREFG